MNGSDFLKAELARRAYIDGFEEGLNGMLAICFTFRNRVNLGWWNGDWAQVLSHHRDASSRIETDPEIVPDPRIYSFQTLLQEIDGIFSGQRADDVTVPVQPTLAANAYRPVLYYARLDRITSDHFLENISRRPDLHPRTAQVGQLFFFS